MRVRALLVVAVALLLLAPMLAAPAWSQTAPLPVQEEDPPAPPVTVPSPDDTTPGEAPVAPPAEEPAAPEPPPDTGPADPPRTEPPATAPPITEPLTSAPPTTDPGPNASNGTVDIVAVAGADGLIKPGRRVPIRVTISAKRLVTGQLTLTSTSRDAPNETVAIDVEVPGGSTKSYIGVLASSPWDDEAFSVELIVDGETIAETSAAVRFDAAVEVVGVLPALASARDLPEVAQLAVGETGQARLLPIDNDWLRAGADALIVYDMLALNRRDLEALGPTEQQALHAWVLFGGRLLVDEVTPPLPGLPDAWQPDANDWVSAGRGSVVLTHQELAAGNWNSVLQPTATDSQRDSFQPFGGQQVNQFAQQRIDQALGAEAGFELPSVKWLVILLAAYVLVVGPLGYLLVRRLGRPLLYWSLVPIGALGFTGLLWATGSALREANQTAHATYLEVHSEGAHATTHILVNSRNGGDAGVVAPAGWSVAEPSNSRQDFTFRSQPNRSVATTELGPGQFGLLSTRGATTGYADAIEVTASAPNARSIEGTVTNNLDVALDIVTVFAQSSATLIGELDPGETRSYSIDNLFQEPFSESSAEWNVWSRFINNEQRGTRPRVDSRTGELVIPEVNLPLWDDYLQRQPPEARPIGQVLVVGWTSELDAPISTDRDQVIDSGRTAVIRQQVVSADGGANLQTAIQHTVRSADATRFDALDENGAEQRFGGGFGDFTGITQYQLPSGEDGATVELDRLVLDFERTYRVLQVWDHETRTWLSVPRTELRGGEAGIPRSAAMGGIINVRWAISEEQIWNEFNQAGAFVRELERDEAAPPMVSEAQQLGAADNKAADNEAAGNEAPEIEAVG